MDPKQILKVSSKYGVILHSLHAKPVRSDTSLNAKPGSPSNLDHCLWMCQEIEHQVQLGERDKAVRWLCFIQGVLWSNGYMSIDSMREDNRDILKS